ncbi:hypothetical protein ACYULU_10970 [Breznakiellaceae bacterium SP9]
MKNAAEYLKNETEYMKNRGIILIECCFSLGCIFHGNDSARRGVALFLLSMVASIQEETHTSGD